MGKNILSCIKALLLLAVTLTSLAEINTTIKPEPTSTNKPPLGAAKKVPAKLDTVNLADCPDIAWRKANLTNFESYPVPGSEECIVYNGCKWAGYFAGVDGKKDEEWVKARNILAVHSKHFDQYRDKTLLLRQGNKTIKAKVLDMCADSDCNGCCTANMASTGFLIDVEKYTMQRFETGSGIVEWKVCQ